MESLAGTASKIAARQALLNRGPGAEDDHLEHLILGHCTRRRGADHLAVLHHRHAIGQIEDVVDVVADEEDADPLALEL
jgi:hypothetical protein